MTTERQVIAIEISDDTEITNTNRPFRVAVPGADRKLIEANSPAAKNQIRHVLQDPQVQLLLLLAQSYPEGSISADIKQVIYRIPRRPPAQHLIHNLMQLHKYGIIDYEKKDGRLHIKIRNENIHLPVYDMVDVVDPQEDTTIQVTEPSGE